MELAEKQWLGHVVSVVITTVDKNEVRNNTHRVGPFIIVDN